MTIAHSCMWADINNFIGEFQYLNSRPRSNIKYWIASWIGSTIAPTRPCSKLLKYCEPHMYILPQVLYLKQSSYNWRTYNAVQCTCLVGMNLMAKYNGGFCFIDFLFSLTCQAVHLSDIMYTTPTPLSPPITKQKPRTNALLFMLNSQV